MSPSHSEKSTVIVTGFGPFGCHKINASWEAVKLLPQLVNSEALGITLVIEEIPVEYEETLKRLQALKEEYNPLLMINVGVSHLAKELTLESCASKHGYERPDVKGKTPFEKACCIGKEPCIRTNLQIERLVAHLNSLDIGVKFTSSDNAGLYLCEFSYYTSLCLNGQNSLFIHVPDIGKPYQTQETARGICEIIGLATKYIQEQSCSKDEVFEANCLKLC